MHPISLGITCIVRMLKKQLIPYSIFKSVFKTMHVTIYIITQIASTNKIAYH